MTGAKPNRTELEQWVLQDLDAEDMTRVELAIQADPALLKKVEQIRQAHDRAAVDMPALDAPWAKEPEPANTTSAWMWPGIAGAVVTLGLAAAALVSLSQPVEPAGNFRGGGFDLEVYRVRLGETQVVAAVVEVARGDRIQYSLEPEQEAYVQVFDVQDDGAVQTWLPSQLTSAHESVSKAAILDGYQGSERVYFVVSDAPVDQRTVELGLQGEFDTPLADLDRLPGLGQGVSQRSILLVAAP